MLNMYLSIFKKASLVIALLLTGTLTGLAQSASVTLPTADTWVSKKYTQSFGSNNTFEIRSYAAGPTNYYGLLAFQFTKPAAGYRVKSATLRLVTRYKKGDSATSLYAFGGTLTDQTVYADVASDVTAALSASPVATFKAKGDGGWAPTDKGISEAYTTAAAWQNTIDLTAYVQSLSSNSFALLVAKDYDQASSSQFFTKEVTDLTNATWNVTFAQADLQPLLTVEYEPDPDQTVVTATASADTYVRENNAASHGAEATMEIFTSTATPANFLGLLSFPLPAEALQSNYAVKRATLRLVTERIKGNNGMNVYAYGNAFSESTTFANESASVTAALAEAPIASFAAAGQWNKAVGRDQIDPAYADLAQWTNTVDVTGYVKTLSANSLHILLKKQADENLATKFFTKERTDLVVNFTDGTTATLAAADLVPQLTVVCTLRSHDLAVTSAGAATLVLPFEAVIPEGVTAYTLAYASGSAAAATPVTGTLPANTPVLINAPAGTYRFQATTTATTSSPSPVKDALTGVWTATAAPVGSYVLQDGAEGVKFYRVATADAIQVGANCAYLSAQGAQAKSIAIDFGTVTAIRDLPQTAADDQAVYSLQGIRMSGDRLPKGVYVRNGRKFMVK